jgi:hypothetical protein
MSLDGLNGLVNRIIVWADRLQRKHDVLGFPYAVVKKYGDDGGGRQAALITYYGFLRRCARRAPGPLSRPRTASRRSWSPCVSWPPPMACPPTRLSM